MQNKTVVVGVAAAIIILLGVGGIFLYTKNQPSSSPNSTVATSTPTPESSANEGSWKDIFSNTGNKKCDIDVKTDESETKGTFYNSGTKAYGEMTLTSSGKTQQTFIIRDNDTFYMWGDSFPSGIKMTISVDEMASKMSEAQPSPAPDQKISFKCTDWTVDSTKFVPPANIKFEDLSSIMKVTSAPSGTANSSQCSICNSLTGSAKTSCLTQLNCQ